MKKPKLYYLLAAIITIGFGVLVHSRAHIVVSPTVARRALKPVAAQPSANTTVEATDKPTFADSQSTSPAPPSVLMPGETQKRYYVLSAPNDPNYSTSWQLSAVNAAAAWNISTGSSNVTVADIDSGFALSHQDLTGSWKYNAGESGGGKESDGIDNDGNGYVDDYRGWNFVAGNNNPQAGTTNPTGSAVTHGTEVAGLIGSVGNNGLGTTAVSQHVSILPLQVIDDSGVGFSDKVAAAINYAVSAGVQVINMSLGTAGDDPIVRQAVDNAYAHNIVVVAAAGNCGIAGTGGVCTGQPTGFITFPASYNRVLAVGATGSNNTQANFSSFGNRLDVMAPGAGIPATPSWSSGNQTSLYESNLNGTSFASPMVASAVALLRAIRPTSSVDDIRALIMAGAAKLSSMSGAFYTQNYGHGLLDVGKAATIASDINASGEVTPSYSQTGGVNSEHNYTASDTISSGCSGPVGTWCTVWFRSDSTNDERYLPYTKIGAGGQVGWGFASSILDSGIWDARARNGSTVSATPYELSRR